MSFPVDVYLGAGSNIDPDKNLRLAIELLKARYGRVDVAPVYESSAVGFEGDDFWNTVMRVSTPATLEEIVAHIEHIHDASGRQRQSERFSSRTLDLDVLLYGDLCTDGRPVPLPRNDVAGYAFVLAPLADLVPALMHPERHETAGQMWANFSDSEQRLKRLDVTLP